MNRPLSIFIAATALLVIVACCCTSGVNWDWETLIDPTIVFPTIIFPTVESVVDATPTIGPTPIVIREPVMDVGSETEQLIATTDVPVRDLHELAIRLKNLSPETPRTINPSGSPDYPVGTRRLFHVSNVDTDEQFDIHAILEYKTEHVYMWVEEGVRFDLGDLTLAADLFEQASYPTNRAFFGSEWGPGVDNDPHLSILHATGLGSVAGYYSSADEFVAAVRDDSNEMEMFYINVDSVTINDEFYNGVLAHEFQHMIHWYNDRNEDTWLNEGFSELAMYLNKFDTGSHDYSFASQPDTQLNSWPEHPTPTYANYGAGYLFTSYFLDRFGSDATQALVASHDNSFTSVEGVLRDLGMDLAFEDLFGDWVVANLLDDPGVSDGRYGYADIAPYTFNVEFTYYAFDYPVNRSETVHQYGTDYIELNGDRPLVFRFVGSTQVGLVDTAAHSGDYFWWSNRGDDSNMTLTRAFDLSDVEEASLEFWTWYDIEEDWDYAYVEVSCDFGSTWEILETPSGTDTDPNGNSFGRGYTGRSGGDSSRWIQERVDLSAQAGQEILVRFEFIADDAVNRPGLVLDDISVPEIGYYSDLEEDDGGWEPAGFIRHANVLPQRWLVQLVLEGPETTVERLGLAEDQVGEWLIPLDSSTDRGVITVSGIAPVTTEMASYSFEIQQQ